tara:strand:- start:645 stop:2225 length:1581 start_codon:yes stop_codon:yes gene_type:complete
MTGGLLQLISKGSQDLFLTENPQISFYKTVYRRYTNFSMDFISILPEKNESLLDGLSGGESKLTFKIKRHADLISNIYFSFSLPAIYSNNNTQFKWVKNLGTNIIKKVSLYIEGRKIDEHYGEWISIWHELNLNKTQKENYYNMIGNIPTFFDPENANGVVGYPEKEISDGISSIPKKIFRVPLIFWFNRNPALALPLIAIQREEVTINIELNPYYDLYTFIDTRGLVKKGTRITARQGKDSNLSFNKDICEIQHYVNLNFGDDNDSDKIKVSISELETKLTAFTINPSLEINYIYLDKEERNKFALNEHKYLIEQVQRNLIEEEIDSFSYEWKIHHPTTCFVIVPKRSDVYKRNEWNNYTVWTKEVTPWNNGFNSEYYSLYDVFNNPTLNEIYEPAKEIINSSLPYQYKRQKNIINKIQLFLNDSERFSEEYDSDFYNKVQTYNYTKNKPPEGILFYSFSLKPFDYQPSGTCNMSRFSNIKLFFETIKVPIINNEFPYKFNFSLYSVNYNILIITSGKANLQFSN